MATLIFNTSTYPTYAALKRAHPEVFSAFSIGQTWFATTHNRYVIGFKPNQNRLGIKTHKNKTLGIRPAHAGHGNKRNKN